MTDDEDPEWDDTESWADDSWEDDEDDEVGTCPECGSEISAHAERCTVCGYWLTPAEMAAMSQGGKASEQIKSFGFATLALLALLMVLSVCVGMLWR